MKKTMLLFSLVAACLVSIGEPVKSMLGADGIEMNGESINIIPIEYLESTGTQWIDTGVTTEYTFGFDIVASRTSAGSICGSCVRPGGTLVRSSVIRVYSQGSGVTIYNQRGGTTVDNTIPVDRNIHNYRNFPGEMSIDGVASPSEIRPLSDGQHFVLFAQADENADGKIVSQLIKAKIYSCRIYLGSVLVRDFIPVRFLNENDEWEGAMYDLVSQSLFTNQGTGSFVIGPDVE